MKSHEGDSITVRLAKGVRVTDPKVPLNLGVTFLDFNSVESLIRARDMILFLVWLGLSATSHGSIGDPKP